MPTTDLTIEHSSAPRTNGNGKAGDHNLSDQVVLSGAGLLTGTIERTRTNAGSLIDVLDDLMLGAFDLVDELNDLAAQIVPQLVAKPTALARKAYTSASGAARQAVSES